MLQQLLSSTFLVYSDITVSLKLETFKNPPDELHHFSFCWFGSQVENKLHAVHVQGKKIVKSRDHRHDELDSIILLAQDNATIQQWAYR